jgi:hypothetical protein
VHAQDPQKKISADNAGSSRMPGPEPFVGLRISILKS